MRHWPLFAVIVISAGCNRQDADGLGRIGRKVLDRTQATVSPLREKFDHTLKGIGATSVKDRVQQRLQWDKALADATIAVMVSDHVVELKGSLKSDEQRRRAIELAESTTGVERVTDELQIE
ncbi:MAG: BON domain-containing protein [Gemmataceae bacterium]|nr:BON domain-containing protein [Gemmataceae bacterium]